MVQAVGDIMTKAPVSLSVEATVRDAARLMRELSVGAIVVHRHGEMCGIVTDRDIVVRCLARDGNCDETPLQEICSRELVALHPDDDVDHAVRLMRDKAIRRIPVVFYTAQYAEFEARALSRSTGVSYVLTKPSDAADVVAIVARAL